MYFSVPPSGGRAGLQLITLTKQTKKDLQKQLFFFIVF